MGCDFRAMCPYVPQTDAEYDENLFATETANHCGAIMHKVVVSQHNILTYLPEAVYHSEGLAVNGHLSLTRPFMRQGSKWH